MFLAMWGKLHAPHQLQLKGVTKTVRKYELRQTDFWLCLHGHLKVGVYDEQTNKTWVSVMGEKRPGVMVIPPPLWHGTATVGCEPAGLLYYVTHQYDPAAPDEDRRDFDSVPGFPWETQHK